MYKYSNCMVLRLPLEILCQICSLIPMTDVTQLCRASPKLAQLIYSMPHLWREITIAMQPLTNTSQALACSQKQTSKVVNDIPDRLAQRLLSSLLSREARNGIRTVKIIDHAKFFFQQDDSRLHEMMQLVFRQCPNLVHFTLQTSSDIDYYSLIDSLNEIPTTTTTLQAPAPPKQFQLPRLSKFELIETHRPRPLLNTIVMAELQAALSNLTPHPAFSQKSCKECREYIGYQQPMCAQCLTSQPDAIRCPFCHWQCDDCGAHFCDVCQKKELVEVLLADYHGDTLRYNHPEHHPVSSSLCSTSNNCPNGSASSNTTLLCSRCVQAHKCNKCDMLFASENLRCCDICQQQSFCSSISDESLTIPEPTRALPLITSVHTIYRDTPHHTKPLPPSPPSHNFHQLTTAGHHSTSRDHHSSESSDEEDDDDEDDDDMGCCRFTEKFIRCKQCKMTGFCTQCLPQAREGIRNWVTVCPTCDEFICPLCVAEGRLPLFFAPGYGTTSSSTAIAHTT